MRGTLGIIPSAKTVIYQFEQQLIRGDSLMKKYKRTNTTLFVLKVMRRMKQMQSELEEHRYYLERNVDLKTLHLTRRIDLLESCNTNLCGKLAITKKELAALTEKVSPIKLQLFNNDVQRVA
jgi:hypothetical protein